MNENITEPIESRIQKAIFHHPHLSGGKVHFQSSAGRVRLSGRVPSFFEKQLAQEALKQIEGVESIDNEIEVDWS